MENFNTLWSRALAIATRAHEGQVDKAGAVYLLHPIRVSQRCQKEAEKIVALLHDVVEDSAVTADDLRNEFPDFIVEAVLALTRQAGETYENFIVRCSQNAVACQVKMHDLEDNMDITRLPALTNTDLERLNKYIRAYRFLRSLA